MIISIHQPNFFPWFGYFLKIARSNTFVFLDDVLISNSSSYVNRTAININGRAQWLTVPVRRENKYGLIKNTDYLHTDWRRKVINTLVLNYSKAKHYKSNIEFIINLIEFKEDNISTFNINVIKAILKKLNVNTKIYYSSKYLVEAEATERLISIIKKLNGKIYLSGMGGDKYQQKEIFLSNSIDIKYNTFKHPEYNQYRTKKFIMGLSILDFLFNIGIDRTKLFINNAL